MKTRENATSRADHNHQNKRDRKNHSSSRKRADHSVGYGQSRRKNGSEVALQRMSAPENETIEYRLVEAVLLRELGHTLGSRL